MTTALAILAVALWLLGMIPTALAGRAEGAGPWRPNAAVKIAFWPVTVVTAVVRLLVEELG